MILEELSKLDFFPNSKDFIILHFILLWLQKCVVWCVTVFVFFFVIDIIRSSILKCMFEDLFKYVILSGRNDNYCVISDI